MPQSRARAACAVAQWFALVALSSPLSAQSRERTDVERFGRVTFANSGSLAAQSAFLRGLSLLHNFQYPRAAVAFREAQQIDPRFAMAYWGEAMTYNHGVWQEQDSVAARALLQKLGATPAQRLAKAPTAREKDYIATLEPLYATTGEKEARDSAYAVAVARLAKTYPSDDEAQLFHALALLSLFPRADSTYQQAATIAERVLHDHPDHPGALHYVIHAYDDPAHATHGLSAAREYSKVAPEAPHAQHMTSHIFIALGMWDDVVAANEVAVGLAPTPAIAITARCGHAGLWLHYAYLQQGRLGDAKRAMDECLAHAGDAPEVAQGYAEMRLRAVIDGNAAAKDLAPLPDGPRPGVRFNLAFANAFDALRRRDTSAALPLIARMVAAHSAIAAGPSNPVIRQMLAHAQISIDELNALATLYRGNVDAAVTQLRAAAEHEESLSFDFGPPEAAKPPRELLGEVLLALHRPAEARTEFERGLAHAPGRSLGLLGLARAELVQGDSTTARATYGKLMANWHRADSTVATTAIPLPFRRE